MLGRHYLCKNSSVCGCKPSRLQHVNWGNSDFSGWNMKLLKMSFLKKQKHGAVFPSPGQFLVPSPQIDDVNFIRTWEDDGFFVSCAWLEQLAYYFNLSLYFYIITQKCLVWFTPATRELTSKTFKFIFQALKEDLQQCNSITGFSPPPFDSAKANYLTLTHTTCKWTLFK